MEQHRGDKKTSFYVIGIKKLKEYLMQNKALLQHEIDVVFVESGVYD